MMNYDEFLKKNEPAFGESEKDYFLRLSYEYKQLQKQEARAARKAVWVKRLRAVMKALDSTPNLMHHKTA